jgi:type VI protein secretion system component VasF
LSDADARLIAAAPELLEALELVKQWDIENLALDIPIEIRAKMQAAIQKARGQE